MHQSISIALSLATATVGHLPAFSAPGVRHLQILRCPGAGRLPGTRGYSRAFDTHAVSYQNTTTQRILLEKSDWFICQGQGLVKACSRF